MAKKNGSGDKPSRKSRSKKTADDDDSSVDSRGNVRNLIDYDYEEDEDASYESSASSVKQARAVPAQRPKRAAAIKAAQRIRRASRKSGGSSSIEKESAVIQPKKHVKKSKKAMDSGEKKNRKRVSEDDSDSDIVIDRKKPRSKPTPAASKPKISKSKGKLRKMSSKKDDDSESSDSEEDETMSTEDSEYSEEEEETEETSAEESDDDEDDDEESEELDSDGEKRGPSRIGLMISSFGGPPDPNQPRRHKMKDQPQIVKKFVKLVQKENDAEETGQNIDNDITYFKKLAPAQQNVIIEKMERKFSMDETSVPLKFKILEKQVPPAVERIAMSKYNALMNIDASTSEYYKCHHWIDGYSNLPLGVFRDLPVKLDDGPEACGAFVSKVRGLMDDAIFGHEEAKIQILQFVSNWIANPKGAGNVLSIHGPMGVGKTTLIKDGVAKALERPFHFITLGGATDASYLDGHSYTYEGSTWGRIAEILIQSKCMNPVIYFDELDKISETPKGEEIMNLLIHLTDGSQNDRFQDKYFTGIDLDLSRCLFIFSHNNHERVNPILRDRMYNIRVQGFNTKEKLVIAEQYLVNSALRDVGLHEKVSISKEIIQHIIENFTGDEKGVRELKRCIQTVMSKLNLLRFYNNPKQITFSIPEFQLPFILLKKHVDLFLKKKDQEDVSFLKMYS
jgi:ATP-dependent Lon protease